ncbi:hypothetical protein C8R44DRAFT_951048 [Mycena epipterygia]|nr:hypothetical protein C8R44DRAFT_951048 [Mycena epipterygia]
MGSETLMVSINQVPLRSSTGGGDRRLFSDGGSVRAVAHAQAGTIIHIEAVMSIFRTQELECVGSFPQNLILIGLFAELWDNVLQTPIVALIEAVGCALAAELLGSDFVVFVPTISKDLLPFGVAPSTTEHQRRLGVPGLDARCTALCFRTSSSITVAIIRGAQRRSPNFLFDSGTRRILSRAPRILLIAYPALRAVSPSTFFVGASARQGLRFANYVRFSASRERERGASRE